MTEDTATKRGAARWVTPIVLFVGVFVLYGLTAARGTLFGDPSEYQFIPAIGGIAHPPGYAFYTLAAKLWQTFVQGGLDILEGDLLCVGSTEYPVRYVEEWEWSPDSADRLLIVVEELKT